LNPMAVELCKVSLWMEAVEPGKPLTFLDHHIQSGNSLLGTTPALLAKGIPDEAFTPIEGDDRAFCTEYRKQNRLQRTGRISISMFDAEARPWEHFGNLATAMLALDDEDADTIEGQRRKQERYEQMVRSDDYLYGRLLADAWCAAFVWKKAKTTDLSYPITHERFLDIERSPFNVPAWMHGEIRRLAEQYGFFHWHLAFPDVFHVPSPSEKPENEQAGWSRGFDVVLGNPPWERIKLQEKEWFATRRPDIAAAPTAAVRKKMIESLKTADPPLYADWLDALRQSDGESQLLRSSGRFPLTGRGDINTYAVFAETIRTILRSVGRVGCIVPTGIATDDTTKLFFQDLMEAGSLVSLFSFENEEKIFPTVHHAYKFCLLTVSGHERKSTVADFTFFVRQPGDLVDRSRAFSLSSGDLKRLNPNSSSCPTFRSRRDAELNLQIYRHVPVLVNEATDLNPWGVRFLAMLHMANDSGLFQDDPTVDRVPLYEAKLFHHFDHRASTYEGATQEQLNVNILPRPTPTQKADPDCRVSPRHWVPEDDVLRRIGSRVPAIIWDAYLREDRQLALESLSLWFAGYALNHGRIDAGGRILDGVFPSRYVPTSVLWADGARRLEAECPLTEADFAATEGITDDLEMLNQLVEVRRPKWLLVFRDIARSTDERTAIFSVLPRVGVGHTAPVMFADGVAAPMPTLLFGSLNCFVFDYAARQKVGGTHLTFGLLRQLPVLPPDAYGPRELAFIVPRVLELTYTAWDLEPFAKDVGYDGPPFRWDEDRRFLLRAELDALYFRLYGIERDDVDYIMETFPIVKRRDEQRHGSYRAKDTILEIYDALADAERTGVPYQTPLDPPPADPRVAHPNRDGTPYTGPGWQLPAGDGVITRQPTEHPNTAAVSASTATAASTQAASRAGGTPKEGRVAASDAPSRRSAVTRLPSQPTLLDRDPLFAEVKAEPTSRPQSRPSQTRLPSQPPLLDRDPLFAEPASDTRPAHPPTAPSPTPPSEPTIPASEDDEQMLRGRVLEGAINVLQGSGPLTARDLAQQLAAIDARIDRRLVNSVLHREGAKSVRYDAARYTYTLRSKS
ncbi:MAG: hypothetical protein IT305_28445, partial [Chloroflexi bacterium]|nr:hypothetical protein [Chloroflexota bacterium]